MIERYLEDLEERIDPETEDDLFRQWLEFWDGKSEAPLFAPKRRKTSPPRLDWPEIHINDAQTDPERMAIHQLADGSSALAKGSGDILNVRCNYGTGILSSLFGAEIFTMPREMKTLPTTQPLPGGLETMRALSQAGPPKIEQALGQKVLAMGECFLGLFRPYPKVNRYVKIYHPDLQGPMDICELLWGSGLFLDIVDEPRTVLGLLQVITDTYIAFMRQWQALVPPEPYNAHWGMLHKGTVMLRDDSAVNFSPEIFGTFIAPFDARILGVFQGGGIHFCGHGDHFIPAMSQIPNLKTINLSQPHLNHMETVFRHTVDRGIPLLGLARQAAEKALKEGRDLKGRVHVVG